MLPRRRESVGLVVLCIALVALGLAAGCNGQGLAASQEFPVIIPQQSLPNGWRLMPSSEMPPIDKTPWWRENPVLLEDRETKQLNVEGQPTSARKVWAATYEKGDHRVLLFSLAYATPGEADAEYKLFQNGQGQSDLLGFSRHDKNRIVFMSFSPECPDRDLLIKHFEAMARPQHMKRSRDCR